MDTTPTTRSATGIIEIEATPERVWQALTDAADLVRWFPLEAKVEPGEGGSVYMSWKNEFAATSKILAWEPNRRLAIVWGWGEEKESQPQVTEYRIEAADGGRKTVLRVVTSGFPTDPAWDDFVEGTNRGWVFELQSLKQYLEHHDGEERRVVYLRHRVPKTVASSWTRLFGPDGLGGSPLGGEAFERALPHQYAAVVPDVGGGLFRASCEPCMPGADSKDVTLWLQAWGDDRATLDRYEREWPEMLARVFPEGAEV